MQNQNQIENQNEFYPRFITVGEDNYREISKVSGNPFSHKQITNLFFLWKKFCGTDSVYVCGIDENGKAHRFKENVRSLKEMPDKKICKLLFKSF